MAWERQFPGYLEVREMGDAEKAQEEVDMEYDRELEAEEEGFQVNWVDVHELEVEAEFQDN